MVKINDSNFIIYSLDTTETIIERIASIYSTIPLYIYFADGLPDVLNNDTENIIAKDLLKQIKNFAKDNTNFKELYDSLQDKLPLKDILIPYVVYNKSFEDTPEDFREAVLFVLQEDLQSILSSSKEIEDDEEDLEKEKENEEKEEAESKEESKKKEKDRMSDERLNVKDIWDERFTVKQKISDDINNNKKSSKETEKLYKQFDNAENTIVFTPFEVNKINFNLVLDYPDTISLYEIFNNIKLTSEIPFSSISNFYKILKEFVPPEDWIVSVSDGIILRVSEKIDNPSIEDFTTIIISIENKEVIIGINTNIKGTNNIDKDKFIQRILDVINMSNIKIRRINEKSVNGLFYFPNKQINSFVLTDMSLNNKLFSKLISVDESLKTNKKSNIVYVHFYSQKTGHISISISTKIMTTLESEMRFQDTKLFPVGSYFIRMKITKADNDKSVNEFQKIFSKLLDIYDTESIDIIKTYKKYIKNFGEEEKIDVIDKKAQSLTKLEPEIFKSGYTRHCTSPPIIVSDDDVNLYPEEQVMQFPIYGESSTRNYVCDNKKGLLFPGLRKNKQSSSEKFPLIPCCFKNSRVDDPSYKKYFYGEVNVESKMKNYNFIKTNKICPNDVFGFLPPDIIQMFKLIDDEHDYYRKGVFRNKSSFLNCVLEGLFDQTNILELTEENERESYLIDIRKKLKKNSIAAACKQEMYDYSEQEILNIMSDETKYLDPKLFVHALELEYECNIYIFTRNNMTGELVIPRHLQSYCVTKRKVPSIFIFEHMGGESDHAQYPQCELIIQHKNADVEYNFEYTNEVSVGVRHIFNNMDKYYKLDKQIKNVELKGFNFINQSIDSYGKTRIVNVTYSDKKNESERKSKEKEDILVTMKVDSIQPMLIPNIDSINKIDVERALLFAADHNIIILSQTIDADDKSNIIEINGVYNNIHISIPVYKTRIVNGIPEKNSIVLKLDEQSMLDDFNYKKKTARYIIETMFYLYSKYIFEKKKNISDKSVYNFFKKNVSIIPDYNYGIISKNFNDNNIIDDKNKLIVTSEEMSKRLVYVLRNEITRDKDKITNYYKNDMLQTYYLDVLEFDRIGTQIILEGVNAVYSWISQYNMNYNLSDGVMQKSEPYMFKNINISNDIYIAQNTDSVNKAINIIKTWNEKKINIGETNDENNTGFSYTLYAYESKNNIKIYKIPGISTSMDIKIIGYKINGVSNFTALLKL